MAGSCAPQTFAALVRGSKIYAITLPTAKSRVKIGSNLTQKRHKIGIMQVEGWSPIGLMELIKASKP